MKHLIALALALLVPLAAHAELPPGAYADMQRRAPEKMTIEVLSVDVSICWLWLCDGRDVELRARVVAVDESASGLVAGDVVVVRYRHVPLGDRAGPSPVPVPRKGTTTPAWLAYTGDHYVPDAGGYSFAPPVAPALRDAR